MKKRFSYFFRLALCSFTVLGSFMAYKAVSSNSELSQTEAVATRYKYVEFLKTNMAAVGSYDYSKISATNKNDGFSIWMNYFSNNAGTWNYIKCGTNTKATLASLVNKEPIDKPITEIKLTVDAYAHPEYINGMKLYVASDDTFKTNLQTKTFTLSVGENTITVPSPIANMYYKLEWDCQKAPSSSDTGYIQISKVEYYYDYVVSVDSVSLTKHSHSAYMGEKFYLNYNVYPSNATNKSVSWSSSNKSVATVNSTSGEITCVSVGTTNITVTTLDGGKTDSCALTVLKYDVTGISFYTHELLLYPKEKYQMTYTITPSNASIRTVTWNSSNTDVATVSAGTITAVGKGTAIITGTTTDGGYTDTCTVTVLSNMVTTPYSPEKTDLLTHSRTGISASTYTSWSNKTFDSGIKYAGKHLGTNGTFKFDSSQNAGIVSTTSGNIVTKVSVVWSDSSADGSDISVYGSESAYSSATSVYNAGQGTLLGHIIKGTSDELIIEGPYVGIGIRPKTGVVEIDSVTFHWEKKAQAADTAAINEFVDTYMHLDYTEESSDYDADARKCFSENWYNQAKVAFNTALGLTNDQKAILMTSNSKFGKVSGKTWTYKDIRDRLEAWARNNHDVFDEYTWTFSSKNNVAKNTNQTVYIAISISIISISSIACLVLFLKRRRYN